MDWNDWVDRLFQLAVTEYGFHRTAHTRDDFDDEQWKEYFNDGYSPREALEMDLSYG